MVRSTKRQQSKLRVSAQKKSKTNPMKSKRKTLNGGSSSRKNIRKQRGGEKTVMVGKANLIPKPVTVSSGDYRPTETQTINFKELLKSELMDKTPYNFTFTYKPGSIYPIVLSYLDKHSFFTSNVYITQITSIDDSLISNLLHVKFERDTKGKNINELCNIYLEKNDANLAVLEIFAPEVMKNYEEQKKKKAARAAQASVGEPAAVTPSVPAVTQSNEDLQVETAVQQSNEEEQLPPSAVSGVSEESVYEYPPEPEPVPQQQVPKLGDTVRISGLPDRYDKPDILNGKSGEVINFNVRNDHKVYMVKIISEGTEKNKIHQIPAQNLTVLPTQEGASRKKKLSKRKKISQKKRRP